MKPDPDADPGSADTDAALRSASRLAAARVDRAPGASVRAAVMDAAANAAVERAVERAGAGRRWTTGSAARDRRRRWPLSAAALLLVSALARQGVTQALRDRPDGPTVLAQNAPRSAPAAADRDASEAPPRSPRLARPSPTESAAPTAPAAPAPRVARAAPTAPPAAERRVGRAQGGIDASRRRDGTAFAGDERAAPAQDDAGLRRAGAIADATAPPPPVRPGDRSPASTSRAAPAPPAIDGLGRPAGPGEPSAGTDETNARRESAAAAGANDDRAVPEPATGATAALLATRARDAGRDDPPTPAAWVDRILKLRAAGNDAQADREVAALARRHPGFTIPTAALGTREPR